MSDTATPWTAACQASLSFTISQSLLQLMSTELMMTSKHLILCCLLLFLPSIFASITVFSNESAICIKWPKYWSFSFNISHSIEYSRWILFRIDWFNLFAVQGTLKSLLQYHSSKASILQHSGFFIVQLFVSHGLQHARLICPSLSPRIRSDSRPLSWWCCLTISSSAARFFCLQSFPASVSWFFPSCGQSIGASVSTSVLPMNIQGRFPLGLEIGVYFLLWQNIRTECT